MTPGILLLAGEASGDQHGAGVAKALRARYPECDLIGLGGPRMESEGVGLLAGLDDLAVMGVLEIVPRFPLLWRLERRVKRLLDDGRVDLVVPIDYAGFNLRIARAAHRRGIPVLYYIAPKVWAWGAGRTARLAEYASRIAVILPFEVEVFEAAGAAVSFVGHPLLEQAEPPTSSSAFRGRWGLPAEGPLLALLPGSRGQEIERHLDLFVAAAKLVGERHPELQPVVARASSISGAALAGAGLPVVDGARDLLAFSRAALVKSGTGTLEAALEGTPFVTVYRANPLTYLLARRLVRVDHVALPNLIAGRTIVPEVLQGDATPKRLAELLEPLLDPGSSERAEMVSALGGVRDSLGAPGASARVADLAAELLNGA